MSHIFRVLALSRTFLWETSSTSSWWSHCYLNGQPSCTDRVYSSPFARDAQWARLNMELTWESPREECQVTGRVEEGGGGPPDPEQMACRKPIVKNRGLEEEGGRVRTWSSGSQLKGRLVLSPPPPKNAQYSSSSCSRRQMRASLGLCVGTPLSLSPECFVV